VVPDPKSSRLDAVFQAVAGHFGLEKNSLKNLSRVSSQKLERLSGELLRLEETETQQKLLFGVVYGRGSQGEIDEMFGNREGSPSFERFLDSLGARYGLSEISDETFSFAGFAGNDRDDPSIALYLTEHDGYELVFHVSTLLPYSETDQQQLARKRKIGNDIVVVVFHEGDADFRPSHNSKVGLLNDELLLSLASCFSPRLFSALSFSS